MTGNTNPTGEETKAPWREWDGRDLVVLIITLSVCAALLIRQVSIYMIDVRSISKEVSEVLIETSQVFATIIGALIGIIAAYVGRGLQTGSRPLEEPDK